MSQQASTLLVMGQYGDGFPCILDGMTSIYVKGLDFIPRQMYQIDPTRFSKNESKTIWTYKRQASRSPASESSRNIDDCDDELFALSYSVPRISTKPEPNPFKIVGNVGNAVHQWYDNIVSLRRKLFEPIETEEKKKKRLEAGLDSSESGQVALPGESSMRSESKSSKKAIHDYFIGNFKISNFTQSKITTKGQWNIYKFKIWNDLVLETANLILPTNKAELGVERQHYSIFYDGDGNPVTNLEGGCVIRCEIVPTIETNSPYEDKEYIKINIRDFIYIDPQFVTSAEKPLGAINRMLASGRFTAMSLKSLRDSLVQNDREWQGVYAYFRPGPDQGPFEAPPRRGQKSDKKVFMVSCGFNKEGKEEYIYIHDPEVQPEGQDYEFSVIIKIWKGNFFYEKVWSTVTRQRILEVKQRMKEMQLMQQAQEQVPEENQEQVPEQVPEQTQEQDE